MVTPLLNDPNIEYIGISELTFVTHQLAHVQTDTFVSPNQLTIQTHLYNLADQSKYCKSKIEHQHVPNVQN